MRKSDFWWWSFKIITGLLLVLFLVTSKQTEQKRSEPLPAQENSSVTMSADAFACDGTNPSPVDALTCNVFHEARGLRGPNNEGWTSVMEVVVNRVEDSRFPNTIPEVVYQTTASGCQFSWYCDGKSDKIINVAKYQEIRQVVVSFLRDYDAGKRHHLTKGAHSYHASTVPRNSYFKRLVKTFEVKEEGKVVSHIFYRDPEIREIARN